MIISLEGAHASSAAFVEHIGLAGACFCIGQLGATMERTWHIACTEMALKLDDTVAPKAQQEMTEGMRIVTMNNNNNNMMMMMMMMIRAASGPNAYRFDRVVVIEHLLIRRS